MTPDLILSANLLVGRPPKRVRRAVRRHLRKRPLVAVFQEAGGYLGLLREIAEHRGYRVIVAPADSGRGMNSSVMLVRSDVDTYASGVAKVYAPWVGPRLRIAWPGRAFPWAVVDLDGTRTLIVDVHMPTEGRGINRLAWAACKLRLRHMANRLAKRHGATAVVFVGDWNNRHDDTSRTSIRRMAKRHGFDVVKGGSPIDYALARGIALVGIPGPARGSDHRSTTYRRKEATPGR
jgi:hypothetical protein